MIGVLVLGAVVAGWWGFTRESPAEYGDMIAPELLPMYAVSLFLVPLCISAIYGNRRFRKDSIVEQWQAVRLWWGAFTIAAAIGIWALSAAGGMLVSNQLGDGRVVTFPVLSMAAIGAGATGGCLLAYLAARTVGWPVHRAGALAQAAQREMAARTGWDDFAAPSPALRFIIPAWIVVFLMLAGILAFFFSISSFTLDGFVPAAEDRLAQAALRGDSTVAAAAGEIERITLLPAKTIREVDTSGERFRMFGAYAYHVDGADADFTVFVEWVSEGDLDGEAFTVEDLVIAEDWKAVAAYLEARGDRDVGNELSNR